MFFFLLVLVLVLVLDFHCFRLRGRRRGRGRLPANNYVIMFSNNKFTRIQGHLPVWFRSDFVSISHRSMNAKMPARWKSRTPFIRPGSRMETDRMKPLPAQS